MDMGGDPGCSRDRRRRQWPPPSNNLYPSQPQVIPKQLCPSLPHPTFSQPQRKQYPFPIRSSPYNNHDFVATLSQPPMNNNNQFSWNPNPNYTPLFQQYYMNTEMNRNMGLPRTVMADSRSFTRLHLVWKIRRGSSNNKANNIPDSLIFFQILPRLPVESILRFRRVCKMWNSLTREKQFVDRSMKFSIIRCNINSTTNPNILICGFYSQFLHCHGEDYHSLFDLSSIPRAKNCRMSNSCHGLICFFEVASPSVGTNIYLVNPSINEVVTLPQAGSLTYQLSLVYDDSIHKYKVVRIFYRPNTNKPGCEILTLGYSQTWRDIGDAPKHIPLISTQVAVGGRIIYWGNHSSSTGLEGGISFDIQSETYDAIIPPKGWYHRGTAVYSPPLYFTELRGCFCIYQMANTKEGIRGNYLNLWLLDDFKSHKWTEHKINLELMENYPAMGSHMFKPLSMQDGKVLLADFTGRFDFYDLENGKFLGKPMKLASGNAISYFETLVSPKAIQQGWMDDGGIFYSEP